MENKNVQSQSLCYRIRGCVNHERSIKDYSGSVVKKKFKLFIMNRCI